MIQKLKNDVAEAVASHVGRTAAEVYPLLEIPKTYDHGHLALPVFAWAKVNKQNPNELAKTMSEALVKLLPSAEKIQPVGGFVNFQFKPAVLTETLFNDLRTQPNTPGHNQRHAGETILVDFSSPNVAKPMHVGHFRATIIGQAICNLARAQGAKVVSINHIGDWGTQFGKLAWAYQKWGSQYNFETEPMKALVEMYVRFHDEAEKDPAMNTAGAETFKKLEDGDPEIRRIWDFIVKASFVEYDKIYSVLGTHHDKVMGESFYNDKMDDVVTRLKTKNLLSESEGAQVVFFPEEEKMAPCIIKKSDGASIYATRDLAAAIYRHEVMKADEVLYVVGVDQTLHFRQVFRVLELMGYEWAKDYHHISFGQYRFKEGKMSTRKGRVLLAEDLVRQSIELAGEIIQEKNPDLENKDVVAKQVAVGAIVFNDLVNDRVKNVEFEWERALSTEGDSGPYVQYTNVRCKSILRKQGGGFNGLTAAPVFTEPEEIKLVFSLLQFGHIIEVAFRQYKPSILAQYLLDVCGNFSTFYHKCRILGEAPQVEQSRLALVWASSKVLTEGLRLLNIPSPEMM